MLGERKRKKRQILLVVGAVMVIAFCVLMVFVLRRSEAHIDTINIHGVEYLSSDDVLHNVEEKLQGNYFFILPRKNISIYPRKAIRESLREEFPRIREIVVEVDLPRTLNVFVKEYEPYALWCTGGVIEYSDPLATSSPSFVTENNNERDCYYLNEQGYIFSSAPSFGGTAYFKYHGGNIKDEPLKKQLFEETVFEEISYFVDQIKNVGLTPESFVISEDGNYVVVLESGGVLILDREVVIQESLQNFLSVLKDDKVDLSKILEDESLLEYVDLRYSGKVYYKLLGTGE